jgi:gentisate 1,2-dioxygenase
MRAEQERGVATSDEFACDDHSVRGAGPLERLGQVASVRSQGDAETLSEQQLAFANYDTYNYSGDPYYYTAPTYSYSRAGQYYKTNEYGANLLPLEYASQRKSSPLFTYPYARSRDTIDRMYRAGPLDPWHGIKMQFVNPATGGYPMPTMGAFLQFLPAGFAGRPYRGTDATVHYVIEGHGRSRIGDTTLTWQARDIFVAPSWASTSHETQEDVVLFSFSDRPVQKALGLWREERLQS